MNEIDVNLVKEFHEKFLLGKANRPEFPSDEMYNLWMRLLKEETSEIEEAFKAKDLTGVLDGMADVLYVLLGLTAKFGMLDVLGRAYEEVHRSNMSKLDSNGKPIYREDGKVLKGPNYSPPDLKQFLKPQEQDKVNHFDLKKFQEQGYLQELNRRFLHPLGLALALKKSGDNLKLDSIVSCQEDGEGFLYDFQNREDVSENEAKKTFIDNLWEDKLDKRYKILGYMIEPIIKTEKDSEF